MTVVRVDGRTSYQLRARGIVTERPNKLSIILLSYYVITNQYGSHHHFLVPDKFGSSEWHDNAKLHLSLLDGRIEDD